MTPVERLQAAIVKLEALKDAAPSGPWTWNEKFGADDDYGLALTNGEATEIIGAYNHHCCAFRDDPYVADGAADLIVTLHRTIDAQLAILRFGINRQRAVDWTSRLAGDKHVEAASLELALADAILGGAA